LTITCGATPGGCFSALQRAEIAEMPLTAPPLDYRSQVSVLFNEPKLLKFTIRLR